MQIWLTQLVSRKTMLSDGCLQRHHLADNDATNQMDWTAIKAFAR